MGIVELKAMVADNAEASAMVSQIEATMQQNLGKISDLEKQTGDFKTKLDEVILSRDKVKEVVKNELNIAEFTPDAIRAKLSTFASDDAIAARDKQFNDYKATAAVKIEELESRVSNAQKIERGLKLNLAIAGTDVMGQTKGTHANDMLMGWISENATFDDAGNITYKGEAGETIYNDNGEPLTLDDRINQIKGDQSRDFVFQSRFLKGGGAPTTKTVHTPSGSHDGGAFVRTKMGNQEKIDYANKYGQEAYNSLPLV